MNPNMNSNACTDTTTFAQYMENNLHLFCIGDCYVNLFPYFPKNDGKAFDEPVLLSIKNAIKLFGNYRLIQIKTYGTYFYFQLKMED
mgnify:FL=1